MKRWLAVLVCLCLLPCAAGAMEGAYLTGEEIKALEPSFEAFLSALADTLVTHGILPESEREAWMLYQLGDFIQNGGFGSISVSYAPGMMETVDAAVAMRRFSLQLEDGLLVLETLRRYLEQYSPLPGLPLDAELLGDEGAAVPCRFRWTASSGILLFWDGAVAETVEVGATYISDGRPLYWYALPQEDGHATLTLDLLHETEDTTLGVATLSLVSDGEAWMPEALQ